MDPSPSVFNFSASLAGFMKSHLVIFVLSEWAVFRDVLDLQGNVLESTGSSIPAVTLGLQSFPLLLLSCLSEVFL